MSLFLIDSGTDWEKGQAQTYFLAKELRQKGYQAFLVTPQQGPLYEKALQAGLPHIPIKIKDRFNFVASFKLSKAMKQNHCLLVHFLDQRAFAVGAPAASRAKIPVRIVSRRAGFSFWEKLFSRVKQTKDVDKIIVPSEGVRKLLFRSGIQRNSVEVIPHGVDFSPFEDRSSKDHLRSELSYAQNDFLVGVVSQLADRKSLEYLVEAAKKVRELTEKIKVIVIGDGPLHLNMRERARELSGSSLTYVLGFRDNLTKIIPALDILVLSSFLKDFLGYVLDAIACRLPVIAAQTRGVPQLVVHNETGLLVPQYDPPALTSAIIMLYRNPDLARRLGERGHEVVQKRFSTQAIAERVIKLYFKVAKAKGVRISTQSLQSRI